MSKIHVFAKKPGAPWYERDIDNTLGSLQAFVQGYIETVTLFEDAVIICNEDGRIRNMPYNTTVCGVEFVGPILFVGRSEDEFCDVPVSLLDFCRYCLEYAEEGAQ